MAFTHILVPTGLSVPARDTSDIARRLSMNRLAPSDELRAGFGNACEVVTDQPPIRVVH
jgi:hypothetical protein